jgi:hypothetical protein
MSSGKKCMHTENGSFNRNEINFLTSQQAREIRLTELSKAIKFEFRILWGTPKD